jgi:serine/threonine protein kinase
VEHTAGRLKSHQIGEQIGARFRVQKLLGQGGFGSVYAVDDIVLKVPLACKEMDLLEAPPGLTGDREVFLEGFLREATALKTIHHPHIPPADYLVVPCGQAFCVVCGVASAATRCPACQGRTVKVDARHYVMMRFLDGETLEARFGKKARPLPWEHVKRWFLQVASAVEELHRKKLLHRDIKPENVLLECSTDHAYLLDLGLVKVVDSQGHLGNKTRVLSAKTQAIGTPGYAPPELYRGQAEPASDVFSLGMLLYWALTDRDPADDADRTEMLTRPPISFNSAIPAVVSEAIARAVKVRVNERFDTVTALIAALEMPAAVPRTTDLTHPHETVLVVPPATVPQVPAPDQPLWIPLVVGFLIFGVSTGLGLLITLWWRMKTGASA